MAEIEQFQPGFRLVDGSQLNEIVDTVNNLTGEGTPQALTASTIAASGAVTASAGITTTTETRTGTLTTVPQVLAAAGATQGDASAITGGVVMVSTTTSAEGVRLPTAVTGLNVLVCAPLLLNVNVYPATGGTIGVAAQNAAVVLAAAKSSLYIAENTTQWRALTGA
jgi:hypothetical protein